MRLAYLGSPTVAVEPLRALVNAGHDVAVVVTGEDKRRGRGRALSPTPVKEAAIELGIPVAHEPEAVLGAAAELGVVVAYGRIIRPRVLEVLPMVNMHFSLLPRWRGAAPVERALLAGDAVTGVCIMQVAEGLDTGDVYASESVAIDATVTAGELRDQLVEVGTRLLLDTLSRPVVDWIDRGAPQHGEPTYADKIRPTELEIDWTRPAVDVDRLVRVGGAWTTFRTRRVKIHAGEVVAGRFVPTIVQPEGKAPMEFTAWWRGARPAEGEWFDGAMRSGST